MTTLAPETLFGTAGLAAPSWEASVPSDRTLVVIPYATTPAAFAHLSGQSSEAFLLWPEPQAPPRTDETPRSPFDQLRLYAAEVLATEWERRNQGRSAFSRSMQDPIVAGLRRLGDDGVALALRRLDGRQRPLWLRFLRSVIEEKPAAGCETIEAAAHAWQAWGRRRGLLA